MDDMLDRLRHLSRDTIVMFTPVFYYDGAGRYYLPEETVALITAQSSVPVYGTDEAFLGSGILGGVLYDLARTGEAAAGIARRVLAGEAPSSIPVQVIDPNYPMFDARQLARWGIA